MQAGWDNCSHCLPALPKYPQGAGFLPLPPLPAPAVDGRAPRMPSPWAPWPSGGEGPGYRPVPTSWALWRGHRQWLLVARWLLAGAEAGWSLGQWEKEGGWDEVGVPS